VPARIPAKLSQRWQGNAEGYVNKDLDHPETQIMSQSVDYSPFQVGEVGGRGSEIDVMIDQIFFRCD
jgi:hypothetical protein